MIRYGRKMALIAAASGVGFVPQVTAAVVSAAEVSRHTDTRVNFSELRQLDGRVFGSSLGQPYEVIGLSLSKQTVVGRAELDGRFGQAVRPAVLNVDEKCTEQAFDFARPQRAVGISFISKLACEVRVEIYNANGQLLDRSVLASSAGSQYAGFVRESRDIARVRVISYYENLEQAMESPTLVEQVNYKVFHEYESMGILGGGVGAATDASGGWDIDGDGITTGGGFAGGSAEGGPKASVAGSSLGDGSTNTGNLNGDTGSPNSGGTGGSGSMGGGSSGETSGAGSGENSGLNGSGGGGRGGNGQGGEPNLPFRPPVIDPPHDGPTDAGPPTDGPSSVLVPEPTALAAIPAALFGLMRRKR